MSTIVQTKTEHYIKMNGEQVPINLSVTGVRCLECNQAFPAHKFEEHLTTHVNPQYIKTSPLSNVQLPHKVNLNKYEDPEKLEEIWVRTMMPSELPQAEMEKKVAPKPVGDGFTMNNTEFTGFGRVMPEKTYLTSDLGSISDAAETVAQLELKKKIKINLVQNMIDRKEIHFYRSEHSAPVNVDNTIIRQRKNEETETQISDAYQMEPVEPSEFSPTLLKSTPKKKQNRQTYMVGSSLKRPGAHLQISTFSRRLPDDGTKTQWNDEQSSILPYDKPDQANYHLMCRTCKGFYCQECKSTIPPIYRPVPDQDGNYHFQPQQHERALQFYREHYYRSNQACKNCTTPSTESRMLMTPSRRL